MLEFIVVGLLGVGINCGGDLVKKVRRGDDFLPGFALLCWGRRWVKGRLTLFDRLTLGGLLAKGRMG